MIRNWETLEQQPAVSVHQASKCDYFLNRLDIKCTFKSALVCGGWFSIQVATETLPRGFGKVKKEQLIAFDGAAQDYHLCENTVHCFVPLSWFYPVSMVASSDISWSDARFFQFLLAFTLQAFFFACR